MCPIVAGLVPRDPDHLLAARPAVLDSWRIGRSSEILGRSAYKLENTHDIPFLAGSDQDNTFKKSRNSPGVCGWVVHGW